MLDERVGSRRTLKPETPTTGVSEPGLCICSRTMGKREWRGYRSVEVRTVETED